MNIQCCETCNGRREVPSGHVDAWGRSCWRVCPTCDGLGAVEIEPDPEPPTPAALVVFDRANHCQQIGTLGGQKTAQTYGRAYMRKLGKLGFQRYAERHHAGNRAAALASLKLMHDPDARVRQPVPPAATGGLR